MKCSREWCKRDASPPYKKCEKCRLSNDTGREERRKAKRFAMAPPGKDEDALKQKLFQVAGKAPVPFSSLCDVLDLSPARLRALIEDCKDSHLAVNVSYDHVGFKPEADGDSPARTIVAPVVGQRQRIGVISDLHFGSKYHLSAQLHDFIEYAYSKGVREILDPGDNLDGCYRHGQFELSHHGIEDQARDMFERLPRKKGLTYHSIMGNHDFTFTEKTGVEVGPFLEAFFRQRGRDDLHCYGNRGALVRIRGALIHLWHPGGGAAYARSYKLQKKIESYSGGQKPQILLAGHWHMYCHVFERGVHAFACPTFQGGGSAFSKSLHDAPAIGGMILEWGLTDHGTMRDLAHEYRAYFERETPQQIGVAS